MKVTLEVLKTLPPYIRVGDEKNGTTMRLQGHKTGKKFEVKYWRDGGLWGYDTFKIDKHGRLFGFWRGWGLTHLMGKEFFPTTREDWAEDNGCYVGKETRAFDYEEELRKPYVCCKDWEKNGWSSHCRTCDKPIVA